MKAMAKKVKYYKLKSLSVSMGGKVFHKSDGVIFSTKNYPEKQLDELVKVGFLELYKNDDEGKDSKKGNDNLSKGSKKK